MGIYIKDMEMPTSCAKFKLFGEYGCPFIGAVGYALTRGERNKDCPLVPVPPHGRLIDADELEVIGYCGIPQGHEDTFDSGVMWLAEQIDKLPTIIPAEERKT